MKAFYSENILVEIEDFELQLIDNALFSNYLRWKKMSKESGSETETMVAEKTYKLWEEVCKIAKKPF